MSEILQALAHTKKSESHCLLLKSITPRARVQEVEDSSHRKEKLHKSSKQQKSLFNKVFLRCDQLFFFKYSSRDLSSVHKVSIVKRIQARARARRLMSGGNSAVPGLKSTMALRQPSSVLSIFISRILETSSVRTRSKMVPTPALCAELRCTWSPVASRIPSLTATERCENPAIRSSFQPAQQQTLTSHHLHLKRQRALKKACTLWRVFPLGRGDAEVKFVSVANKAQLSAFLCNSFKVHRGQLSYFVRETFQSCNASALIFATVTPHENDLYCTGVTWYFPENP